MSGKYDDIIHRDHHVSSTRARMPMQVRAAQFSPFAALTGYEEAIQETGRLTDARIEPSEDRTGDLNAVFRQLLEQLDRHPRIRVTYFQQDLFKFGGAYVTETHSVVKADLYARILLTENGEKIPMDDIWELEIV